MTKRSTNLNRANRSAKATPSNVLGLARWLGMTDEEIKAMAEREKARQAPQQRADACELCGRKPPTVELHFCRCSDCVKQSPAGRVFCTECASEYEKDIAP